MTSKDWIEELDPICLEKGYPIYNVTDDFAKDQFVKDQVEIVIKAYVLPCVLAFGLFGNLLFLFVVARVRSMRTITNLYLVNIAFADLLYLTVGVGEKLFRYHASPVKDDQTPIGDFGCVFFSFMIDINFTASLLFVTMVTIERYYAICRPFWHRRIATWKRTTKLIIATWIVSICLAVILIPGHMSMTYRCLIYPPDPMYDDFPSVNGYCKAITSWYVELGNGFQVIPFFIAMLINSVLYTLIIKSLHARVKTDFSIHSDRYQLTQVRNSVTKMLVINGVVFFVLLSPYMTLSLTLMVAGFISDEAYSKVHVAVDPVWPIFQTLMYINSAVNAYIFGAANHRYRQALVKTFACPWCKKEKVTSTMSMKSSMQTISDVVDNEISH